MNNTNNWHVSASFYYYFIPGRKEVGINFIYLYNLYDDYLRFKGTSTTITGQNADKNHKYCSNTAE